MDSTYTDFQYLPKKQQQLMTAGGEIFSKYGVRRVSVQEICDSAGVSKMIFYKFFSNKWDLAKAVMESATEIENEFYQFTIDEEYPFSQKVEDILMLALARMYGVGLGQDFYDDISNPDSPLYDYYREQRQKSEALVAKFFRNGQESGYLNKDAQLSFLLFSFQKVSDWVMDPAYIRMKPDIVERIQEVSSLFFHGFSKSI